jgi:hypothetical protein
MPMPFGTTGGGGRDGAPARSSYAWFLTFAGAAEVHAHVRVRVVSLIRLNRDRRMYEWETVTVAPLRRDPP